MTVSCQDTWSHRHQSNELNESKVKNLLVDERGMKRIFTDTSKPFPKIPKDFILSEVSEVTKVLAEFNSENLLASR